MYDIEMQEMSQNFFKCWKAAGIHSALLRDPDMNNADVCMLEVISGMCRHRLCIGDDARA